VEGTTINKPTVVLISIEVPRQRELLEIAQAHRTLAHFPRTIHHRYQDRYQQRDNGNDHQKLNERESGGNASY